MKRFEDHRTEFKTQYTSEVKKTIIAFANSEGGTIYFGVDDDGSAIGLENPDDVMTRVSHIAREAIKPDITLFTSLAIEEIEGKAVVVVSIQKGPRPPYYLAGKGLRPEGVYVRHGAVSLPATDAAIFAMIKDSDGNTYESMRSTTQELTFDEASKEFEARDVAFGDSQKVSLGIASADGVYTNLGLLLSDQCPHTIKAAFYEGLEKEIFRDRREFSGSLFAQLNDAYLYIDARNQIRSDYEGLRRIDSRDYPEAAVREALLNSLIHREYSFHSSTLISIFEDRLEFVSTGGLPKGIELEDIMAGVSLSRNERLANVFYRLNLIESYGTGIPKIYKSYKASDRGPSIQVTKNAFRIMLPNRNADSTSFSRRAEEGLKGEADDDYIKAIVETLKNQPFISRREVDELLGTSQSTSSRILKSMLEAGMLEQKGKGKSTKYGLSE